MTGGPPAGHRPAPPGRTVSALAPDGVSEIVEGDDLAALVLAVLTPADGDVVVVTSKAVSKAEGRVATGTREDHLEAETDRVVARRGPTTIARTHHGLTLAAAGIDASNVETGRVVLLPLDPDASARRLRAALRERTGVRLAVVVTDTAGRAWREGQTDLAIGAAGLVPLEDHSGRHDAHGNELVVTAPAVADEIASLAELSQGKLAARPFALVRGRGDLVLDDDGPGAAALVRAETQDLFGYGAREAVVRAVAAVTDAMTDATADGAQGRRGFGSPADGAELAGALEEAVGLSAHAVGPHEVRCPWPGEALATAVRVVAFAHGWAVEDPAGAGPGGQGQMTIRPAVP